MQQSSIRNFALSLALSAGLASADTITLTNGEVLEGEIFETKADSYVFKIRLKGGIKDLRTYKKADVKSIEKEAPDKKPFEALADVLPIPELLKPADYSAVIEGRLKPFVGKFPKSKHLPEVQKMLAQYEEELKKVTAGDVKLDGKWISAAEWNADAIENDAMIEFSKMEKLAKRNAFRGAMMQYDMLQQTFAGTKAADKARDLAGEILPPYQSRVSQLTLAADDKLKKREQSIENLPSRDQTRVRLAFEQKMERHKKALEKARENKNKWIPINDLDSKSLKKLRSHIESTLRKLERPPRKRRNAAEAYRAAWAAASKGDEKGMKRPLAKLKSAKADPKYFTLLQEQLEANPAPTEVKMVEKPKMEEKPKAKPEKKEKKKRKKRERVASDTMEEEPEESGSMLPVLGGVGLLAVLGGLLFAMNKKKKGEE